MSNCSSVILIARAAVVAGFVSLSVPASAAAHGLAGGYDPGRPVAEYLWLGFWHMLAGWDHLLFIAGVVLLAGNLRSAAKLLSLFVAGHSLTLIAATLAGWRLDPTLVDAVIALSLVYVGVLGWRGRPRDLRFVGVAVFAFGLVHGLGLATRLEDLGLPDQGLLVRVVLFNVGVEVGQLTALAIMVLAGMLLVRRLARPREVRRAAFGMLAAAGLVAAAVISFPRDQTDSQMAERRGACVESQAAPPQTAGGGHPPKRFYGPRERAPETDLDHVRGDGYVVVRYRPDLRPGQLALLERLASGGPARYVIVALDVEQKTPVRALTAGRALSCTRLDMAALERFRADWLASLR